ncbi:hypothetical protein LJC28_04100 [Dysgonomonas sp. OttesenSCG-928-D17]|nr:hypothetical protein [Dysgonomonas sp. OttesenSCG-928-D17]
MNQKHLTEDETIEILEKHLINKGYKVKCCYGMTKGCDIIATKPKHKDIYIEVKGARPGYKGAIKPVFNNSQITTHFGKAIYQILRRISDNQDYDRKSKYAIAHPNDPVIRKVIEKLTPLLKDFGIVHYWVNEDGSVIEE